jgi:hypothetical protein
MIFVQIPAILAIETSKNNLRSKQFLTIANGKQKSKEALS